jgi:hypothetical protein
MNVLNVLGQMWVEIVLGAVLLAVAQRLCSRSAYRVCLLVAGLTALAAGWMVVVR